MPTVANVEFGPDVVPLGRIFERFPDATIELERIVPTRETVIPYFWLRGLSREEVGTLVADPPRGTAIERVDSLGTEHLVRTGLDPGSRREVLIGLVESNLTLVSAHGTVDGWQFELRADEHDSITRFRSYCRAEGIAFRLVDLHPLRPPNDSDYGLTEKQRVALVLAYERGYYASPSEVGLEEMADQLGISRQAVASRLKRGIHRLLRATIAVP